nr:hypothetical protein [Mixta theicola]
MQQFKNLSVANFLAISTSLHPAAHGAEETCVSVFSLPNLTLPAECCINMAAPPLSQNVISVSRQVQKKSEKSRIQEKKIKLLSTLHQKKEYIHCPALNKGKGLFAWNFMRVRISQLRLPVEAAAL